jgi:hypothetical protein
MTAKEVSSRLAESLAALASAGRMWQLAQDEHSARVAAIQSACSHESTHLEHGQYEPCTNVCDACGADVD